MQYITSVERIGYNRGMKQGILLGEQQGILLGEQQGIQKWLASISKQVAKKFQSDPELELTYMAGLDADDLSALGELILDFQTLEQVHEWIDRRINEKKNLDSQDD